MNKTNSKTRTKKKRRRGRRYKTGIHISPKSSRPIKYKSNWELQTCIFLDWLVEVKSYEYESIQIPYVSNQRTGKIRTYFPDFDIVCTDGTKKLVEVKRFDKLTEPKTIKKLKSGEEWCRLTGIKFEIWTNDKINEITKLNKQNHPHLYPPTTIKKPIKRKKKRTPSP